MESLTYGDGKHLFLSIVLDLDSDKLKSLDKVTPGLRKKRYQPEHKSRILLPLRASQTEEFAERRQRIKDEFVSGSLVELNKFFVEARAAQVIDLLVDTPYKVRQICAATVLQLRRSFAAAHVLSDAHAQHRLNGTLEAHQPDHRQLPAIL
jgi:hypothetical protein